MEQKDSRFAVLIDADNVSPKYIKYILDEVSDQGVATYKRIYGDWTDISKKSWKEQLLRYSINPIQQYSNTNGKNSTDSAMIIDAMDILYSGNVEGFCLVSSDSDFTKLAQRLRESGMFVLGMGEQKTPSSFRVACDAFKILEVISQNEDDISPAITAVSENPARYGTSQDETPSITSKAEIERTVSRVLTENNDHGKNTTLSEIGSILQKKFSEFDVRNYGYSKLSTFLESMLRPERFLCRVTEQSIEDADAAKHLPGSLFHNGPLVVVRVRVKGGPCRQQTYGLQRVFVRLPPQKAGHFRVGCPVRIHLLGILG